MVDKVMSVEFSEAPSIPEWLEAEYAFNRRMATVDGWKMHFVDEGEGRPVLLVHGNPTWSFLWRKVIQRIAPEGVRAIAPDLIGLGLSDKPPYVGAHTLDFHISQLVKLVDALDLRQMTIVGQDWGGPIVTGAAARMGDRTRAAVYANTAVLVPKSRWRGTWFHQFSHMPVISELAFRGLNFPVPILDRVQGDRGSIGSFEKRAYRYPLQRWRDRAAPLAMARMVPNGPDHPSVPVLEEIDAWVRKFSGPVALVWGLNDPILGRSIRLIREVFPDAPYTETQAGHFLQEEVPDELADAILKVTINGS